MTHDDMLRTVVILSDFSPPEGVDFAIMIQPAPGNCRVRVGLSAIEGDEPTLLEMTGPPTEDAMRQLYRTAQAVLDAAWDSEIKPGPAWAADLGLNLAKIGGDG